MGRALSNILCIISIMGIITCACFYVFGMHERSTYEEPLGRRLSSITELGIPHTPVYNYAIEVIDKAEKKEACSIYLGIFFILLLAISIVIRGASKPPEASYATGIAGAIVIFLAIILIGVSLDNHIQTMRAADLNIYALLAERTNQLVATAKTEYEKEKAVLAWEKEMREFEKRNSNLVKKYREANYDVDVFTTPHPRETLKNQKKLKK